MLVTMLICFIGVMSASPFIAKEEYSLAAALFSAYITAFLPGSFLGLIIGNIRMISAAMDNGGRKRIPFYGFVSARSRITSLLQKSDPYFSYDKFEGQLVSLIKMSVFAESRVSLACFEPDYADPRFDDIVDMTFCHAITLKDSQLEGNLLHVILRTWWINYSYENGRIKSHGDCIDVSIKRNISKTEQPGFSITSVSCDNCGGSFDAVRQSTCPYCGTTYHMENYDWVIEKMELVR